MSIDMELHDEDVSFGIPPRERAKGVIKSDPRDHALDGLHVVAGHGQYKSYRGIIKDTNPIKQTARVELEAGQQVKTLKIAHLMELE